ncbi:hypothetical protein [Nonomuraea sp. LPB2021202275-12-8]|uniref:hypothetical protein n=1 Tax=Nonomuraea sp. LPB2021202275-12-8 TaxID=3120159 RepID=UPI00300CC1E3
MLQPLQKLSHTHMNSAPARQCTTLNPPPQKLKRRTSSDAVVGGFVGSPRRSSGLLLGRYDDAGRLRVVGRTIQLSAQAAVEIAPLLTPRARRTPVAGDTPARLGVQSVR